MAAVTVSSAVDTFLQSEDADEMRSNLGVGVESVDVTWGENVGTNKLVFLDPANSGDAYLVDATDEDKSGPVMAGMTASGGTAAGSGSMQVSGVFTYSTGGLTAGGLIYADPSTAGSITQTRPTGSVTVRPVGIAESATTIRLFPFAGYVTLSSGINTQTGTTYTLALSDANGVVEMDVENVANTVTIPTNAAVPFPTGTAITVVQYDTGLTTVAGDTGVTLNGASAGTVDAQGQYTALSLYKRGTNEWIALGS